MYNNIVSNDGLIKRIPEGGQDSLPRGARPQQRKLLLRGEVWTDQPASYLQVHTRQNQVWTNEALCTFTNIQERLEYEIFDFDNPFRQNFFNNLTKPNAKPIDGIN